MDQHNFSDQNPEQETGQFWGQFSEQWQEILAGYVLGALEADEMLAVEEYLEDHQELSATVHRLEETMVGLAYSAPTMTPSPAIKATLLDRIHADMRATSAASKPVAPVSAQTSTQHHYRPMGTAGKSKRTANVGFSGEDSTKRVRNGVRPRSVVRRRSTWWSFDGFFDFATGWKLATLTASAALLFFVVTTVQLSGRLTNVGQQVATLNELVGTRTAELNRATGQLSSVSDLQDEIAQLQAEKAQLQQTSQQVVDQLQNEQQQISSLLTVSQVVELGGTKAAPQAQGTLFVGEESLVLVLRGLQPLPPGETYQLWLIPAESDPVSAGLVQISDEENPSLTTDVHLTVSSFAVVGLSIEPAGGSVQPTGDIVMLGNRT